MTEDLVVRRIVVVDVYERESRVLDALRELDVRFVWQRLSRGDYSIGGVVVERKSVRDLHLAIIQRRLWRQVARLQEGVSHPYLLVEGEDLDAGPLRPQAVRGALVALAELGIPVIRSVGPEDSALWLKVIAERPDRRVRAYRPPRPRAVTTPEAMLCAIPGISRTTARNLLAEYGSIAHLATSDPASWLSVPGIGPARANSLAEAIHQDERLPPSRARSARPARAT